MWIYASIRRQIFVQRSHRIANSISDVEVFFLSGSLLVSQFAVLVGWLVGSWFLWVYLTRDMNINIIIDVVKSNSTNFHRLFLPLAFDVCVCNCRRQIATFWQRQIDTCSFFSSSLLYVCDIVSLNQFFFCYFTMRPEL